MLIFFVRNVFYNLKKTGHLASRTEFVWTEICKIHKTAKSRENRDEWDPHVLTVFLLSQLSSRTARIWSLESRTFPIETESLPELQEASEIS